MKILLTIAWSTTIEVDSLNKDGSKKTIKQIQSEGISIAHKEIDISKSNCAIIDAQDESGNTLDNFVD